MTDQLPKILNKIADLSSETTGVRIQQDERFKEMNKKTVNQEFYIQKYYPPKMKEE